MNPITLTLEELSNATRCTLTFDEKIGEVIFQTGPTGQEIQLGIGPKDQLTPEKLRQAGGHLANWLVKRKTTTVEINLRPLTDFPLEWKTGAFSEGLLLGGFRFHKHKPSADEVPEAIRVRLVSDDSPATLETSLAHTARICAGQNLAREWSHEPPNVINPVTLADRVSTLAKNNGLKCTILEDAQLEAMGAGAIVAVGKGSDTPARLIVLEYPGKGTSQGEKPVAVLGKAITFDTGGYTLKTRDGMVGMKYDKCGAMAVAGILQTAAALQLEVPVVGIIAAAENMISGHAYRPNDIIKSLSGKTIEIISADAEGRMVLADALTYAERTYTPRAIIDLATLTGGAVVALGNNRAAILSNNESLTQALIASGEKTHERLWQMPLDEEYLELIKGDDSDLKNSGGRKASPIIGGKFLEQFLSGETPWAHIDIAGTATTDKPQPYCPKGATGFGVRLVLDYLEGLSA